MSGVPLSCSFMIRPFIAIAFVATCFVPAARGAPPATQKATATDFVRPELPRKFVDTAMPAMRGKVTPVPNGGDLQAALNAAQSGDTLVLEAGAVYSGPVT